MPTKLSVVLAFLAISAFANLLGGSWFALALNAASIVGVMRGSEMVRRILIGLSGLGAVMSGFGLLLSFATAGEGSDFAMTVFVVSALGLGQTGYTIWALNQPDVQAWMFQRSLSA